MSQVLSVKGSPRFPKTQWRRGAGAAKTDSIRREQRTSVDPRRQSLTGRARTTTYWKHSTRSPLTTPQSPDLALPSALAQSARGTPLRQEWGSLVSPYGRSAHISLMWPFRPWPLLT